MKVPELVSVLPNTDLKIIRLLGRFWNPWCTSRGLGLEGNCGSNRGVGGAGEKGIVMVGTRPKRLPACHTSLCEISTIAEQTCIHLNKPGARNGWTIANGMLMETPDKEFPLKHEKQDTK